MQACRWPFLRLAGCGSMGTGPAGGTGTSSSGTASWLPGPSATPLPPPSPSPPASTPAAALPVLTRCRVHSTGCLKECVHASLFSTSFSSGCGPASVHQVLSSFHQLYQQHMCVRKVVRRPMSVGVCLCACVFVRWGKREQGRRGMQLPDIACINESEVGQAARMHGSHTLE